MNVVKYIKNKIKKNDEIHPDIKNATLQNTPKYNITGFVYGKCVKVYDGDTVTIATRFNNATPVQLYSVRISGIDTAELRSKNLAEKKVALNTRNFVADIILNRIVKINITGLEKYGRLLGDVHILEGVYKDTTLSSLILTHGLGYVYGGKTKKAFHEWYHE
jgi:micrococcal nuclease